MLANYKWIGNHRLTPRQVELHQLKSCYPEKSFRELRELSEPGARYLASSFVRSCIQSLDIEYWSYRLYDRGAWWAVTIRDEHGYGYGCTGATPKIAYRRTVSQARRLMARNLGKRDKRGRWIEYAI